MTGHREGRLASLGTVEEIIDWIKSKLIENNCTDAYCGMANGGDILFGKTVISLRKQGYDIKLHCILPCKDYNKSHLDCDILKENSDSFEYLSEDFYKGCDNTRDQKMVEECEILLALCIV